MTQTDDGRHGPLWFAANLAATARNLKGAGHSHDLNCRASSRQCGFRRDDHAVHIRRLYFEATMAMRAAPDPMRILLLSMAFNIA